MTKKQLYTVGMEEYHRVMDAEEGANNALIAAVAAMLTYKPKKVKEESSMQAPYIKASDFYDMLLATNIIVPGTSSFSEFSYVGKWIRDAQITPEDFVSLRTWIDAGSLGWIKSPMTWRQVTKPANFLLGDWVLKARAFVPAAQGEKAR